MKKLINKFLDKINNQEKAQNQAILLGKILSKLNNEKTTINSLHEIEFKVYSQWGDDGIIQYLVNRIDMPKTFVEFGVETYNEANTRFLLINDNWSGLIMDGSKENIEAIYKQDISWRYDLKAVEAFITTDNINHLISSNGFLGEIGILSVDIDGNDYWVLETIDVVDPVVIIVEYNSTFGPDRYISVPFDPAFYRTKAHYSNLFYGASLPAFHYLCEKKGYVFVGCNSNGNNAYFVRKDKVGNLPQPSLAEGFVLSKFKEDRDQNGVLTYRDKNAQDTVIKGMEVVNVKTNNTELF
jgi:hypothetical protein